MQGLPLNSTLDSVNFNLFVNVGKIKYLVSYLYLMIYILTHECFHMFPYARVLYSNHSISIEVTNSILLQVPAFTHLFCKALVINWN